MTITELEFLERARIDHETLKIWIEEQWLIPARTESELTIHRFGFGPRESDPGSQTEHGRQRRRLERDSPPLGPDAWPAQRAGACAAVRARQAGRSPFSRRAIAHDRPAESLRLGAADAAQRVAGEAGIGSKDSRYGKPRRIASLAPGRRPRRSGWKPGRSEGARELQFQGARSVARQLACDLKEQKYIHDEPRDRESHGNGKHSPLHPEQQGRRHQCQEDEAERNNRHEFEATAHWIGVHDNESEGIDPIRRLHTCNGDSEIARKSCRFATFLPKACDPSQSLHPNPLSGWFTPAAPPPHPTRPSRRSPTPAQNPRHPASRRIAGAGRPRRRARR